jgi:hypothetical protein
MAEPDTVTVLIDRIVREARIPGRKAREDVRRELASHFEAAASAPGGLPAALHRFGSEEMLTRHFHDVYRWDYAALYLAKIAASLVVSVAAALAVQILVNLRLELQAEALRLAPEFTRAARLSVAVVLGLVTAWEIGRQPFDGRRASIAVAAYAALCIAVQWLFSGGLQAFGPATFLVGVGYVCSRLDRRPARLLLTFCAFAVIIYFVHLGLSVALGAGRAVAASAALVAVWASTVAILSRLDHAFLNVFTTPEEG